MKGGQVSFGRKFFPGYVLVEMDMDDDSWHLIKNTPKKVTGFVGGTANKPTPITQKVDRLCSKCRMGLKNRVPNFC